LAQDYTLLLLSPAAEGDVGALDDALVAGRIARAAEAADIDLGGMVRARLLGCELGRRAVRLETSPDRARWGPFWLEAELGFPEFRLVRQLATHYEVIVVAYSEKLRMGWIVSSSGDDLAIQDLRDEPLPPDVKGLIDLLATAPIVRDVTRADRDLGQSA
jgi:hypothetical protein